MQEGYAARHSVNDGEGEQVEDEAGGQEDPMQGLEGLDVAGPRLK